MRLRLKKNRGRMMMFLKGMVCAGFFCVRPCLSPMTVCGYDETVAYNYDRVGQMPEVRIDGLRVPMLAVFRGLFHSP